MNDDLIRVIVVDDHDGVRRGIRNLLANDHSVSVVAEAEDGLDALQAAADNKHDVILLDVELPNMRGDEVARRLVERFPDCKIVAISSYDDPQYVRSMMENGAKGYVTKDEVPSLLLTAIHGVVRGEDGWMSKRAIRQTGPLTAEPSTFTLQERRILSLLADGLGDNEIAEQLEMDPERLERFMQVLEGKLRVKGRPALAEIARAILDRS